MFDSSAISVFIYLIYPVIIISVGLYVSITKEMTLESYYFADRKISWLVLGTSLIASSLFGPYLFGLSFSDSVPVIPLIFGIISIIMVLLLGWYFVPIYQNNSINTLPEYFEKRFNKSCKYFLSSLYICMNVFIRLVIILIAGNTIISMITGIDAYFTMIFFLLITSIFLIIGGLQAEMIVNVIQMFLIIIILTAFIVWLLNQNENLQSASIDSAINSPVTTNSNSIYNWAELAFGLPIIGFWFWNADQFIVQKVISFRNRKSFKKVTFFTGAFQVIPVLIFVIPAIVALTFSQRFDSSELMNLLFKQGLLPDLLKGGVVFVVAGIIIGAFANLFNATSMLITFDFYRSFKKNASGRELVLVGRLTIILLLFFAILILPSSQVMNISSCLILLEYFSIFTGVVSAVFIAGIINKKLIASSALLTLIFGSLMVLLRILLSLISDGRWQNKFLLWYATSGFLEFTIVIFLVSIAAANLFNFISSIRLGSANSSESKNILIKIKYVKGVHKTVFIILSVLFVIIIWWIN